MLHLALPVISQTGLPANVLAEWEKKYGKDADLLNGEKYFYPYSRAEGDPFLDREGREATLRIRGKVFGGQMIKYDIYRQQLVLLYEDLYGGTGSLVLRNEWVESFDYGPAAFTRIKGPYEERGYFQVIYEGSISCYRRWTKEYKMDLSSGVQNYYFTEPAREDYLMNEDYLYRYRNNRSFTRIFDAGDQKTVRTYLGQNRLKVKKMSASQMGHLMEYCNSL